MRAATDRRLEGNVYIIIIYRAFSINISLMKSSILYYTIYNTRIIMSLRPVTKLNVPAKPE